MKRPKSSWLRECGDDDTPVEYFAPTVRGHTQPDEEEIKRPTDGYEIGDWVRNDSTNEEGEVVRKSHFHIWVEIEGGTVVGFDTRFIRKVPRTGEGESE